MCVCVCVWMLISLSLSLSHTHTHTHQQRTKTSIKIFSDPMPNSNERSVQLIGTEEQITDCTHHFLDEISKVCPVGQTSLTRSHTLTHSLSLSHTHIYTLSLSLSLSLSDRKSHGSQYSCMSPQRSSQCPLRPTSLHPHVVVAGGLITGLGEWTEAG